MEIFLTRADGVLVHVEDQDGHTRRVVLSWKDIQRLELERRGYEVLKAANRYLNKRRPRS